VSEADHSPPSSAEVNNAWSYTSTPPYLFMAWFFIKYRDNYSYLYLKLVEIYPRYKFVSPPWTFVSTIMNFWVIS